jgi:hypothetical protein
MYPSPEVRYAAQLIKRYTTLVAVCCDDAEALLKAAVWPELKGLSRHRRERLGRLAPDRPDADAGPAAGSVAWTSRPRPPELEELNG